jgi:hypothetical protein
MVQVVSVEMVRSRLKHAIWTTAPHFEALNRPMNNYGVNTKSMFDVQVIICGTKALVLVFLGEDLFSKTRTRNSSVLCCCLWALVHR